MHFCWVKFILTLQFTLCVIQFQWSLTNDNNYPSLGHPLQEFHWPEISGVSTIHPSPSHLSNLMQPLIISFHNAWIYHSWSIHLLKGNEWRPAAVNHCWHLTSPNFLIGKKCYLFNLERNLWSHFPSAWNSWDWARLKPGTQSGFLHGWRKLRHLSHHLCHLRGLI